MMGYFEINSFPNGDKFIFKFVSELHGHLLVSVPFSSKVCCLKGIVALREVAPFVQGYVHKDLSFKYSFDVRIATGEIIASNRKGYFSKLGRDKAIRDLRSEISDAPIYDRS